MNLLISKWVPVSNGSEYLLYSYKEILCKDSGRLNIALPRDDLEMACLQLLTSLTQVIFMPSSKNELRERIKTPLTEVEYYEGIAKYNQTGAEWFDLDHENYPFMQIKGIEGEWTSIQKIMIGMPEATSKAPSAHSFYNDPFEIRNVSGGIAAIAIFNQAMNSPSFGGGFKNGLRGPTPISTMIKGKNLRDTIWKNVLSEEVVKKLLPWNQEAKESDNPVWITPIDNKEVYFNSIGILRGLFWQPACIKLTKSHELTTCDITNIKNIECYTGFIKKKFNYDLKGEIWPHPYSPRQIKTKKDTDQLVESYLSFTSTDPAWTQLSELVFQSDRTEKTEGYIPAPVVSQYYELYRDKPVHLIIGGYRNKQASILQRRHELYSLPVGWNDDHREKIKEIVNLGNLAKDILINKVLYPLIKGNKKKGIKGIQVNIKSNAVSFYFQLTEPYIHKVLRETSLKDYITGKAGFLDEVIRICMQIYDDITKPYANAPEFTGVIALGNNKLKDLLRKLRKEHVNIGGDE